MSKRPNIIFYFADQQRWDTVNEQIMPNLSLLSEDGVSFDNAFTCQPVCGPARACLQSGTYATQIGCFTNGIPLPKSVKGIAEYLNEGGYETAYVGKWHLASDKYPGVGFHCENTAIPVNRRGGYKDFWRAADVLEFTSHGYDGYVFDEKDQKVEFSGYRADAINDFALQYLAEKKSDKPFFLFVSQLEPHHQNDCKCFQGYKPTIEQFKAYPIPKDLSFLQGDYKESYPDYLSAINRLDYNVGRLTEELKSLGIYDDTVIIYTSDHGCHFKTRNMEYKRSPHDSCTHIPLVLCGGYVKKLAEKGMELKQLVSLIDLPPTILDLAGAEVPPHYVGKSLLNLIKEPTERNRESVFMQISESQIGRAIRTEKYLYAVRAAGLGYQGFIKSKASVYFDAYLYDVEKDPAQQKNLVNVKEYAQIKKQLRALLSCEMLTAGEEKPIILRRPIARKK